MSTARDELRASIARRARREWPQPVEGTPYAVHPWPPLSAKPALWVVTREGAFCGQRLTRERAEDLARWASRPALRRAG